MVNLHKVRPLNISSWTGPFLPCLRDNWQNMVAGRESAIFFNDVVTDKLPKLQ